MGATNEGLIWKGEHTFDSSANGFTYEVRELRMEAGNWEWHSQVYDSSGIMHRMPCATPGFGKKFCESHHASIQSAISKHRLDAERLAKTLELAQTALITFADKSVHYYVDQAAIALAAHREAIK